MLVTLILVLILLGVVLWWLLDRHEKRRLASGLPRHSGIRLAFGAAALLTMLFSGGCSLLFGLNADGQYVSWPAVLIVGGPPFLIAALVWWVAMRRSTAS